MDLKILAASFALVFLAELGDKTQLTAMALTTSSKSGWSVFAGTSLALIATTALAVAFGALLTKWVPQNVLHIVSAVAFILIGVVLLVNVARKAPAEKPGEEAAAVVPSGNIVFSLVARQAAAFEEEIIEHLEALLPQVTEKTWRETIQEIVAEDRKHMHSLAELPGQGEETPDAADLAERDVAAELGFKGALRRSADVGAETDEASVQAAIQEAVYAEEHLSHFYLALARQSKIHAAKDAFRWLAMEDLRHAERLCSLVNPEEDPAA